MISVNHLSIEFSARPLFTDASFVINAKERVALTGKNGAGKSTLLKIIVGLQHPTSGSVDVRRDTSIGYLPQVMQTSDRFTVKEEVLTVFSHQDELNRRHNEMMMELSEREDTDSDDYLALVEQYSLLSERLSIGTHDYEAAAERTLKGLGFKSEDLSRPTSELSGGWRMRIELAKLLLQQPDLLLLDEPTNHLDIESIGWLESFLQRYPGAVVLISHDRAFLNNVTTRTLEISCGKIVDYKVKYDEYVRLRAERREQQLRAYENQQKEIADIKDFIERFRYKPTKAVQVQSRIKHLEKIVPIEVDEVDNSYLHLKFPPCLRSGDYPIICDEVAKAYGNHQIFSRVNLTVKRGEKIAFVGRNGEGKSTLVKCIMGEIPFDGKLTIGHNVSIGYYAQNQAQLLDENITVFETIDNVAKGDVRLKIRDILGAFMFGGEASDKKVKVLSGGERSRLAMIKLLLEPVNLLILDEPTNHLDLRTKDVLKEAISAFDGTVIVVSHDRDFLDGLVEKVYEFADGQVREHIGGIYDFLRSKNLQNLDELQMLRPESMNDSTVSQTQEPAVSEGKLSYEQMKERNKLRTKLERNVKAAEERVGKIESEISTLEQKMTLPENMSDSSLFIKHGELQKQLEAAMNEWEEAANAVEEFNKE